MYVVKGGNQNVWTKFFDLQLHDILYDDWAEMSMKQIYVSQVFLHRYT